jgi:hypothetical protein
MSTSIELLKNHEKRLQIIEKQLKIDSVSESKDDTIHSINTYSDKELSNNSTPLKPIDLGKLITIFGIIGVSLGAIFFFFYAVATNLIGEVAQITIGFATGILLFVFGYVLFEKNPVWSLVVFGGSYFINYLTIGVGTLLFNVIPFIFSLVLALCFVLSSIYLAINFNSRVIAYFSLVGGFFVPFLVGALNNDIFILNYLLLFVLALTFLSFYKDWSDVRGVSFLIVCSFLLFFYYKFNNVFSLIYLLLFFLLFHISSLRNSIFHKSILPVFDAIVLGLSPLVFLPILYNSLLKLYSVSPRMFSIIIFALGILYLIEIMMLQKFNSDLDLSIIYTVLASAVLAMNIGLLLFFQGIVIEIYFVFFSMQYLLFMFFSKRAHTMFFSIVSYIFLFLTIQMFMVVNRFTSTIFVSTVMILISILFFIILYILSQKEYGYPTSKYVLAIGIFIFGYTISNYLNLFVHSDQFMHVILSIFWIAYSLFIIKKLSQKTMGLIFLAITILKIAFLDLLYLTGIFRILGFIIFGVILLIGGFFIRK